MVQLQNILRNQGPMQNLLSLLSGKRLCRALFTTVRVYVDHFKSLVMWMPRNLQLSARSTTALSMWMVLPLFLLIVHNQLIGLTEVKEQVIVLAPHC